MAYVDSGFVFTAENGEGVHAGHVDDRFGKAPVPVFSFHATLLLRAGAVAATTSTL